jgi:CheY-like chemotaxis protein
VLVVDDDPGIQMSLEDVLVDCGYSVAVAENGRDALDYLRRSPAPDVVLLDLMMPVLDGWGFRVAQREDPALRDIPVIVMSAGAHAAAVEELGAAAFIRKPFSLDDLLALIAHHAPGSTPGAAT